MTSTQTNVVIIKYGPHKTCWGGAKFRLEKLEPLIEAIKNLGINTKLQQILEPEVAEFVDEKNVVIAKTEIPSLSVWKVNEPAELVLAAIKSHFGMTDVKKTLWECFTSWTIKWEM